MLLMEHESKELLESYGIKTARCIFAASEDEAVAAAKQIGFPVAMKVASRRIVHKSDVGGVALNISSEDEVREAFRRLMSIENAEGVNVQPMLKKGIEIFVGVAENEQFGSIIAFGLGGYLVELLGDVAFRLIPITRRDAEEMVRETKAYALLSGYRNMRGDVESVVDLLLRISKMVEEESIVEMDLNPVFVYEKGCVVADARIVVGERKRFERRFRDISKILSPKSVAIIGASSNPIKVGYSVVKSLSSNPKLRIYPVNPKLKDVCGFKAYPSILDVPDNVDLAVIALPAEKVLQAVEQAVAKGVKGVLIISSGFREAEYEEGKVMQEKLAEIARKNDVVIIGPNTFGIVNVVDGINASFTPMFSKVRKGNIALVSQSGGICHYILHTFSGGFSYILHLGNRCDVDFPDALKFLEKDDDTKVVAMYVEGVDDGRSLYNALRDLCRKKPVVVMKAGKSSVADKASISHTGSMAGDWKVFSAAMRQAGAVVVNTPVELSDVARALEVVGKRKGGVAVLAIQAGLGIVAADIIEESGGRLAKFSDKTSAAVRSLLPPITMRDNPVDLSFSGLDLKLFSEIVKIVSADEDVGVVLFLYAVAPPSWVLPAEAIKAVIRCSHKPVIIAYSSTPEDFTKMAAELEKEGVLVFNSVERAARVSAQITQ